MALASMWPCCAFVMASTGDLEDDMDTKHSFPCGDQLDASQRAPGRHDRYIDMGYEKNSWCSDAGWDPFRDSGPDEYTWRKANRLLESLALHQRLMRMCALTSGVMDFGVHCE